MDAIEALRCVPVAEDNLRLVFHSVPSRETLGDIDVLIDPAVPPNEVHIRNRITGETVATITNIS